MNTKYTKKVYFALRVCAQGGKETLSAEKACIWPVAEEREIKMLQLEHLAWQLPGGESILKGVDMHVPKGKLVVVTGPNGGGKTSLAKLVAGLETPHGRAHFV